MLVISQDPEVQREFVAHEVTVKGLAQGEPFVFQTRIFSLTSGNWAAYPTATPILKSAFQWNITLASGHYGFAAAVREIPDYWMPTRVLYQANGDKSF